MLKPNPLITMEPNCCRMVSHAPLPLWCFTYAVHSSIGNLTAELDQEESPGFQVKQCLDALVPLELVALNAGHVIFDS